MRPAEETRLAGAVILPQFERVGGTIRIKTPAILLGTTSRFVFLHEPQHRITHIIPNERIAELIVEGKKKKGAPDPSPPATKR